MEKTEFTAKWLDNLKPAPPGNRYEIADTHVGGLRVRVGETPIPDGKHRGKAAQIAFVLAARYPPSTQPTRRVLGAYQIGSPHFSLQSARQKAIEWKALIAAGIDPARKLEEEIEAREAERLAREETARARKTVAQILDRYEDEKLANLKRGAAVRRALDGGRGLFKGMADRELKSLSRYDIAEVVRAHAKRSPISANRQLAYAQAFLNWCVGEELLAANPALSIKKPSKETQRDRFHTLDELAEIWAAASTLEYPFGPLFKLLITLPMRREEVAAIRVAELNLGSDESPGSAQWVLPADRTKRANALRIPLSSLSRSILKEALADQQRPKGSPFVFSTTGETSVSGFTKARRRLDAAIADARKKRALDAGAEPQSMDHWTVHDLRTTFNTHACERLGVDANVADRILNHVATATTSKIMRVYNKSELFEPRRKALADWAALLEAEVIRAVPAGGAQDEPTAVDLR
jgi:integrase